MYEVLGVGVCGGKNKNTASMEREVLRTCVRTSNKSEQNWD